MIIRGQRTNLGNPVTVDGRMLLLEDSLAYVNHSPTGFTWGGFGSGPAQLAFAILLEIMGPEYAQRNYQQFKTDYIAKLPQADFEFTISPIDILKYA